MKPSPQTPLTAERFALALKRAGVPSDLIQVVHLSPQLTNRAIGNPSVAFVSFTGSVSGGRSVAKTAATVDGFTGVALEVKSLVPISYTMLTFFFLKLGGKDPAYVRADADLNYTVAELVDGEVISLTHHDRLNINQHDRCLFQLWSELLRGRGKLPNIAIYFFKHENNHLPQRIYVHESIYDSFVERFVAITKVI